MGVKLHMFLNWALDDIISIGLDRWDKKSFTSIKQKIRKIFEHHE